LKTIAILTPKTDTFSNPTLTLLIERLIEENYTILFYGSEQMMVPEEFKSKLNYYPLPFRFYEFQKNPKSVKKIIKQYLALYKNLKFKNKTDTVICVDPMGFVIAGRLRRMINVRLIYASFEIFFKEEFKSDPKKIIKDLEIKYSKYADLVLIQDERREKLLKETNNFRDSVKFIHIPVSPKQISISRKSNLRSELSIPEDKTIVVYSGTLMKWSGINEILDLFNDKWNPDFWLVIHSHNTPHEGDEFWEKINCLISKNKNISFHSKPFNNFKDYAEFLSGCDIGIATYFPDSDDVFAGKNIEEIGLASGKFSSYMMIGIPTITTQNSMYKELNNKYNFGETIKEVAQIPEALIKIKSEHEKKVAGCKEIYAKVLNPETGIQSLMNYIGNKN
jgi:hypothetical protein